MGRTHVDEYKFSCDACNLEFPIKKEDKLPSGLNRLLIFEGYKSTNDWSSDHYLCDSCLSKVPGLGPR